MVWFMPAVIGQGRLLAEGARAALADQQLLTLLSSAQLVTLDFDLR